MSSNTYWQNQLQEWARKEHAYVDAAQRGSRNTFFFLLAVAAVGYVVQFTVFMVTVSHTAGVEDSAFLPFFMVVIAAQGWMLGKAIEREAGMQDLCRAAHAFVDEVLSEPESAKPFLLAIGYVKEDPDGG